MLSFCVARCVHGLMSDAIVASSLLSSIKFVLLGAMHVTTMSMLGMSNKVLVVGLV
jgi:hypothetical protein